MPEKFETVQAYFDSLPENIQAKLMEVKNSILKVKPDCEELLVYNVPAYGLVENAGMEEVIMIAGFKKHIGFYPHPTTMEKFEPELQEYKRGKGSVQFPLNQPMPLDLVERMVRYRLGLLEGREG